MPYTDADLTALRTARLRGIRTVQFADRTVTYQSDAEYRQLEQDILRDVAITTRTRSKQTLGVSSKGF